MKNFPAYFRSRYVILILFAAYVMIAAAVFGLYGLPPGAFIYTAVLCFTLSVVFAVFDYLSFSSKHDTLAQILGNINDACGKLPSPSGENEKEYREIIEKLYLALSDIREKYRKEKRERDEYYTLWMHQIKTPLAALRLIVRDDDTERGREIEAQLFTTERYVAMALAYLRAEAESTDYLFREYELDTIVRQSIRKYAPMFIRKKISLELSPVKLPVVTDEKWLCFVIEQILSNAVKYTPANGCVKIFTEGETLVISDSGIGIMPEDLPRIFEEGFTGCNGRRDKSASGIGLYLSKKVLDRLGHGISIVSKPGEGTSVRLQLHTERCIYE